MMMPIHTDLQTWASSLIIDFPTQNVPLYHEGDDWKTWGNFLIQGSDFSENGAPGTEHFSEWNDWAMAVYRQMANFA